MCTIIFIAKIPLQFQIKQELHRGLAPPLPLDPLPGLCPGLAVDLGGPQTSCLTRKETVPSYGIVYITILEMNSSERGQQKLNSNFSFFSLQKCRFLQNDHLYGLFVNNKNKVLLYFERGSKRGPNFVICTFGRHII